MKKLLLVLAVSFGVVGSMVGGLVWFVKNYGITDVKDTVITQSPQPTKEPTKKTIPKEATPTPSPKVIVTPTSKIKPTATPRATATPTITPSPTPKKAATWRQVLFDIGEWNVNNGETTTQKFQITSNTWRIRWAKRATTMMSIEVFDSSGKTYGTAPDEPYTADFNQTEGTIDFSGAGTYYVHFIGGTNQSAGEWDITVEELQ